MPRNQDRIAAEYARMWNSSKEALALGNIEIDPVPENMSKRWGVSAVIRPTEPVLSAFEQIVEELARYTGIEQVLYNRSNLHTTVRSIEGQRLEVTGDDPFVRQYIDLLQGIVKAYKPLAISYRGLTATRAGVMAQGWPEDDRLQDLRDAFHDALRADGLLAGPEAATIRQTAHTSLTVFTHKLVNAEALAAYVGNHRETFWGVSVMQEIDIVRYIRTDTDVKLTVFGRIAFGAGD